MKNVVGVAAIVICIILPLTYDRVFDWSKGGTHLENNATADFFFNVLCPIRIASSLCVQPQPKSANNRQIVAFRNKL